MIARKTTQRQRQRPSESSSCLLSKHSTERIGFYNHTDSPLAWLSCEDDMAFGCGYRILLPGSASHGCLQLAARGSGTSAPSRALLLVWTPSAIEASL